MIVNLIDTQPHRRLSKSQCSSSHGHGGQNITPRQKAVYRAALVLQYRSYGFEGFASKSVGHLDLDMVFDHFKSWSIFGFIKQLRLPHQRLPPWREILTSISWNLLTFFASLAKPLWCSLEGATPRSTSKDPLHQLHRFSNLSLDEIQ